MRTEPRAFRFKPETVTKIDALYKRYGGTRTEMVERAIHAYNGEPMKPKNVLQTESFKLYERDNVLFVKQKGVGKNGKLL